LIIIAMSIYRQTNYGMSYMTSYTDGGINGHNGLSNSNPNLLSGSAADPRFLQTYENNSLFNNAEPPVFWNMGNVGEVNDLLQNAAVVPEDDAAVYAANVAVQRASSSVGSSNMKNYSSPRVPSSGFRSFASNPVPVSAKLQSALNGY
jgi:hypothetical protein